MIFLLTAEGIGAFALITLGVIFKKLNVASNVIHPMIRREISRAGTKLLPMFLFVAIALGFLAIGQTVTLATRFGAFDYVGAVMVTVVERELGPLLAAVLALTRAGTANVIELGTARALWATGSDRRRALLLATRARDQLATSNKKDELAAVNAFLAQARR